MTYGFFNVYISYSKSHTISINIFIEMNMEYGMMKSLEYLRKIKF